MSVFCTLWWLLAALGSPTVADLGAPEFEVREAADDRLRTAGVWAYPAVADGCRSVSPEVAARCERLAVRPVAGQRDAWAVAVLLGGIEPDYPAVVADSVALRRLHSAALALGCPETTSPYGDDNAWDTESRVAAWFMHPDDGIALGWFLGWDDGHAAREGVAKCREDIQFRFLSSPTPQEPHR